MKTFLVHVAIDTGVCFEYKTGVVMCEKSTEIDVLIEKALKKKSDYSNDMAVTSITSIVLGEEPVVFFLED